MDHHRAVIHRIEQRLLCCFRRYAFLLAKLIENFSILSCFVAGRRINECHALQFAFRCKRTDVFFDTKDYAVCNALLLNNINTTDNTGLDSLRENDTRLLRLSLLFNAIN